MLRLLYITVIILSFTVSTALAGSCYTDKEAEAEQGIRIHSELMVIGLNCQHMKFSDGTNLYAEYRKFTAEHGKLFAYYETTLMDYFSRTGLIDPEAEINTLRTDLANKVSGDAASMRPDLFCNRYAARILKVAGFSTNDIREWATTFFPSHPVSNPVCEH